MLFPAIKPVFVLVLALFLGLSSGPATASEGETDHLEAEARVLADWLISCQRAGWEEGEIDHYLEQWHPEAVLILARAEEPGPYDQVIEMEQLAPTRRLRMTDVDTGVTLSFSDIRVRINGQRAVVSWRAVTAGPDAVFRELMRERYRLEKHGGQWKVVENRAWFLGLEENGEKTLFSDEEWSRRDAAARAAKQSGDARAMRAALLDAYRFPEAHAAAVDATGLADADAGDWAWRGFLAVIASDASDAARSFIRARELNPEIGLPPYARNIDGLEPDPDVAADRE